MQNDYLHVLNVTMPDNTIRTITAFTGGAELLICVDCRYGISLAEFESRVRRHIDTTPERAEVHHAVTLPWLWDLQSKMQK